MDHMIIASKVVTNIFNLTVAIMTGCNDVGCPGSRNLIEFYPAIGPSLIREPGLQCTTTAAAAIIIVPVGDGINKIFFSHNRLDHKPQIIHNLVGTGFSAYIAGVLNREFGFDVFIPVGIDFQLSFPDPLGVKFYNGDQLKFVRDIKFSQPFQDCIVRMPSLGIDHHGAFQVIVNMVGKLLNDIFPALVIGHEHTVVFTGPHDRRIGPVCSHHMKNLP